ncbi:unnamed protein product [Caenorhabditis auriculariae]|uniref:Domain of unknown function WSN domain-containing protein n=1 Tax=Caenorhabditis auriculariae TaxID=2777116 RepID=A0A8S1HCL2_9PELO|nr:unnamed protein product [Caenorhabditis auriculariae]
MASSIWTFITLTLLGCFSIALGRPAYHLELTSSQRQDILSSMDKMDKALQNLTDEQIDFGMEVVGILFDSSLDNNAKSERINKVLKPTLDTLPADYKPAVYSKINDLLDLQDYAQSLFDAASPAVHDSLYGIQTLISDRKFYRGMTSEERIEAFSKIMDNLTDDDALELSQIMDKIRDKMVELGLSKHRSSKTSSD